jgi:adenylate kinase
MLREAVAAGTKTGLHVSEIMDRGELVPGDIVVTVVADPVDHSDAANGFVLDGFPRTLAQAEALTTSFANALKLDAVLELRLRSTLIDCVKNNGGANGSK